MSTPIYQDHFRDRHDIRALNQFERETAILTEVIANLAEKAGVGPAELTRMKEIAAIQYDKKNTVNKF